ncbi:MAG: hypothetical protein U1E05_25985 [Patescibacteria group bacterium]|nr:hypothetical protein [Patescibacteria group bacterium]
MLGELVEAMSDPHPVVRYWGATGCLILQKEALPAKTRLLAALHDDWADVRIVAAEALGYLGEAKPGLKTLEAVLHEGNQYEVLAALNTLDFMHQAGHVPLARVQAMVADLKLTEPANRIPEFLLGLE